MDTISEKYNKGFNNGYFLKQHKPDLIEKLLTSKSHDEYLQGMKDGYITYQQQKTKKRAQQLRNLKSRRDNRRDLEL